MFILFHHLLEVNLHFPGGQTLGSVTVQHPGLEFQVFNVSFLPLLVQQPVQQQSALTHTTGLKQGLWFVDRLAGLLHHRR